MTPAQFAARVKRNDIAPAYLFLGSEAYERLRAREALVAAVLGDDREAGLTRHDLAEVSLAEVIDDARALSLFASKRVIVVANAEAALPRGRQEEEPGDGEGGGAAGAGDDLAAYMRSPSPGVVLVFEAARWEFEGEEKKKLERVRKFYGAIPEAVELKPYTAEDARQEAQALVKRAGIQMEPSAIDLLVESLGANVARIATEVEKLRLFAANRAITVDDISALVPDARATTIFALVGALGRRDRARALQHLDTLSREGEYLPLALAFLSTQFRLALAAKEAGLRSASQVQSHLSRAGVPMWSSRAEQVWQTVSKFSKEQIERAMGLIYEADKGLRSARPDDRIVMEDFVLRVTASK